MERPPLFDEFADDYERHTGANAYNALYDRPAVLGLLGDLTGLKVLDVGCGPGLYAAELVATGAEVVAFDQSPRMVELAQARLGDAAQVRVHDLAHPLDWLPSDSFDAALMALVIHHVDDRIGALREINRVLCPGGHLVVSTHHPTSDWLRFGGSYFTVEPIAETWSRGWTVSYWRMPLGKLCDEFLEAGFLIDRIVEPLPAEEMAEQFPDDYNKLSEQPAFIAFKLLKPG